MLASFDPMGLEPVAREVLAYLVERSVAGALVFGVVLLIWLAFRRWTPAGLGSAWFLVPLVVFAAPVERLLPNPWPGPNPVEVALVGTAPGLGELLVRPRAGVLRPPVVLADGALAAATADRASRGLEATSGSSAPSGAAPVETGATTLTGASASLPWASILFGLWLAIVGVLLARFALVQRGVLGVLRRARPLSASQPGPARAIRRLAGRRPLAVLETDELASPATWGLGRRTLLFPTGLAARLDPTALEWVVRHELAHLERRDHAVDLAQRLVQIAFFFHPLVWFANRHVRAQRELACDEAAQVRCAPSERGLCARALLDVAAFASGLTGPRTDHAMVSLLDHKTLLRNRIMNLSTPQRRSARTTLGPLALVGFSLAALGSLAPAQFGASEPAPPSARPTPQQARASAPAAPTSLAVPAAPKADDSRALAQAALERGLAWLIAEQGQDGGWHDVQDDLPGVPKIVPYFDDIGATALAVQALARHAEQWPDEPEALQGRDRALVRGLDHLLETQDELGSFGPQNTFVYLVGHALGTEALALGIARLSGDEGGDQVATGRYREALERAVVFAETCRNPYGGWRYDYPPTGDNDSMQTGRMLLALVAAYGVEVHAAPQTFAGGYSWFEEMHDSATDRIEYMQGRPFALRVLGRQTEFPADKVELATALDMVLQTSRETEDLARLTGGAKLLLAKPPAWSRATGTTDFTYWMYGTRAMAVLGGLFAERWNDAALEALLPHQLQTGADAGAWPGADAWSAPGLRTYPTAANCMTLIEVLAAD